MKIAVVGSGVSGLVCAHKLQEEHEVTLIEADDRLGGHVNTIEVPRSSGSGTIPVDTGFIVFNEKTYPNFIALLGELGVPYKTSDMSFSVRSEISGLEYNGTSTNALFAQRSNLFRPSFWRMTRDILRFYKNARELLDDGPEIALGDYLARGNYSKEFVRDHLVPMGAAVWSATPEKMLEFPARTLVTFFENHGFLQVEGRPKWLVVEGGSREWVRALLDRFQGEVRPSTPILGIQRDERGVQLFMESQGSATKRVETFDRVVLATHGDQALRLLGEESKALEREVLSNFQTQENRAFLHTDERLLPRRPLARAAWNYHILPENERPQGATVSYWMNLLQGFDDGNPWIVSLNMGAQIDPQKVEREIVYRHPIYTTEAIAAQQRHSEINGLDRVYFAGAYWGYGFHEDGVKSALAVVSDFERREKNVG